MLSTLNRPNIHNKRKKMPWYRFKVPLLLHSTIGSITLHVFISCYTTLKWITQKKRNNNDNNKTQDYESNYRLHRWAFICMNLHMAKNKWYHDTHIFSKNNKVFGNEVFLRLTSKNEIVISCDIEAKTKDVENLILICFAHGNRKTENLYNFWYYLFIVNFFGGFLVDQFNLEYVTNNFFL